MSSVRIWGPLVAVLLAFETALAQPAPDPVEAPTEAEPESATDTDAQIDELTSDEWAEPRVPLDLHWQILAIPERFVELAFAPLGLLISGVERYRLDKRFKDLLRNDAGTIVANPKIKFSGGDGFGFGGGLKLKSLLGQEETFTFGGLRRGNADYQLKGRYNQTVASLEGRLVEVQVIYELDQDSPWYGIGHDTTPDDERVIENRFLEAMGSLELTALGAIDFSGDLQVGYVRETLTAGTDPGAPGVGVDPMDTVATPPGFDETNNYIKLAIRGRFDSRDTAGRTTRGVLAELTGKFVTAIGQRNLGSVGAEGAFKWYWSFLPRHRTIAFTAGLAVVNALTSGDDIPTFEYVTLGRRQHLRGYRRGRFRDQVGWWSSLEYQYPVFEYQASGVALSPIFFVDAGRVTESIEDLAGTDIEIGYGFGFHLAHESKFITGLEYAFSKEGRQLQLVIGSEL
jgi:hypothetical protein